MELQASAKTVVDILRRHGHEAYFVGGSVRDMVMGTPSKDYDIATSARPGEIIDIFDRTIPVGVQFGVVRVRLAGHEHEVATFRSDVSYSDGRRPDAVSFTTAREDVARRDFTINGLLLDPTTGEIVDHVGGLTDIEAGIVRAIGDPSARFDEDKLRLLRAVRFAARFGFAIDEATWQAMVTHAPHITQVSVERIRDELTRILTEGGARHGFELLSASGLLEAVLPEVAAMGGVEQPPEFHPEGDVWEHTLLLLEGLGKGVSETLAWGCLLHDVGKPPTFEVRDRIRFNGHDHVGARMSSRILRRLKASNAVVEQVKALVKNHLKFMHVKEMRASTLKRFLRMERFDEHLALHRLDCLASHGGLDLYDFVVDALGSLDEEDLAPPRLLTGKDLIAMGLDPGPRFKVILRAVEDAQLDGAITTTDEARALVERLVDDRGGHPPSRGVDGDPV